MQSIRSISPIVRAVGVIGAVAILVTSITYAALQSQVTLTNNTIATGTADLQIASASSGTAETPGTCGTFGDTAPGFAFAGVVPGGADSQTESFCLRNNGTSALMLKVKSPTVSPLWTTSPSSATVDNTKVSLTITCDNGAGSVTDTLANFLAGDVSFASSSLPATTNSKCTAKVHMDATAFSGESATLANFDLVFTGTPA